MESVSVISVHAKDDIKTDEALEMTEQTKSNIPPFLFAMMRLTSKNKTEDAAYACY